MTARAGLLVVVVVLSVLGWSDPAAAHATLVSTVPTSDAVVDEAPESVTLIFTEPVAVGLGGVKVLAPDGSRVERGSPRLDGERTSLTQTLDAAARGTHTVVWTVTSEDNHIIEGALLFSVGTVTGAAEVRDEPQSTARLVGGVGRASAYAGTLGFVGVLAFSALALRSVDLGPRERRRLMLVALVGSVLIVIGAGAALLSQVAISSGRSLTGAASLAGDALTQTRFGALGAARVALGVSAGCVALSLSADRRRSWRLVAWSTAAGLVLVPAVSGHAWATSPRALAVAVDGAHLAAVAVWFGGLVALVALGWKWNGAEHALAEFSRFALLAVCAVIGTGLISSYLQVRSIAALTGTGYGVLLLIKVGAVVALIALGWSNRRRLGKTASVLRVVRVEALVAVAVVAITATLVNRPPARTDLVRPFSEVAALSGEEGNVQIEVRPSKVGSNDVHLYFLDPSGLPAPIDAVEVSIARNDIPARRLKVTTVTADHVSAYGASFPSPGLWTIGVLAAREGRETTASVVVGIR